MNSYIKIKSVVFYVLISCMTYLHASQELPIVVIIPSYNNEQYVQKNLDSVCCQHYANLENIIYINDASTDQTGFLVDEYVRNSPMRDKFIVMHNEYNRKALMNIYTAAHMCDDNALIVVLDGDDEFAHDHVLAHFNRVHSDEDIWLSYAQYINWPPLAALHNHIPIIGYAAQTPQEIIDAKNYRWCYKWFWSGLRAFRAWFFKCVKIESLFLDEPPYQGKLLPIMYDAALLWPMMEMGGNHMAFIPDILLTRNMTPLNDFHSTGQDIKKAVRKVLRSQKVYPTLESRADAKKIHHQQENRGAATLLFSSDNPKNLAHMLSKIAPNQSCCVVYSHSEKHAYAYQLLAAYYSCVLFLPEDQHILLNEQLIAFLTSIHEQHLFVACDKHPYTMGYKLHDCIDLLERTYAYAFYFDLTHHDFFDAQHTTPATAAYERLDDTTGVWQFKCWTPKNWKQHRQLPTLYRISDTVAALKKAPAYTIDQLLTKWAQVPVAQDKVGLFCIREE